MAEFEPSSAVGNRLAEQLAAIGAELPSDFTKTFRLQANRLNPDSHEELAALVLIECYELNRNDVPLTAKEIWRVLDRIRHRLSRQASAMRQRYQPLKGINQIPSHEISPEQKAIQAEEVAKLLSNLKPHEVIAIDLWMTGAGTDDIMRETGMKYDAARQLLFRALKKLRNKAPAHGGRTPTSKPPAD